jgi:hypothetical protein
LSESERIRSYFGSLAIEGIVVEIMGDVTKRQADGAWGLPTPLAAVCRTVTVEGMTLPVIDLAYEAAAYEAMGRVEKARRIREFIR